MPTELMVPRRRLGLNGPEVPLFALGSWNTWDRMEFDGAVALVTRAVEVGAGFFDVAHYNMGPHAEQSKTDLIFARAVREAGIAREQYILCGKLWLWDYPAQGFAAQLDESLSRLAVDRADLVVVGDYMERPDLKAVVSDVAELMRQGRFGGWGVNNWTAADLLEAIAFARSEGMPAPCFAQLKYSVVRRSMAEGPEYAGLFETGEFSLQASDVLEGGILAGKLTPARKIGADPGQIRERIKDAAGRFAAVAADFGASAPQLAIAFCLSHPAVANVLFGVSRPEQLEDNLKALKLFEAHGAEIRRVLAELWLDQAVPTDGSW